MPIPTKAVWLSWTERKYKHRSSELRKLDDAIGEFEVRPGRDTERNIQKAFMAWKRAKGPEWRNSERNQPPHYAFTELDRTLKKDLGLSAEEKSALEFWKAQRAQNIQRVFGNATVTLRIFDTFLAIKNAKRQLKQALEESSNAGSTLAGKAVDAAANAAFGQQIAEIRSALSELFGVVITDVLQFGKTVLAETGLSGLIAVAEEVATMLPLVSLAAGGISTLVQAGKAVKKAYEEYSFSRHSFAFEAGNVAAAFDAVSTLLARETANQATRAGIEAAALAANTALHAAKGAGAAFSPVVGAAKAAANAVRAITKFAIECRETLLARKALRDPSKLDLRVFKKCPLLGAYMLIGSDTSDLIALLFEEFGQDDWMTDVEKLVKKHIKPALDQCAALIQSSPFIIKGVPAHRKITGYDTMVARLGAMV